MSGIRGDTAAMIRRPPMEGMKGPEETYTTHGR